MWHGTRTPAPWPCGGWAAARRLRWSCLRARSCPRWLHERVRASVVTSLEVMAVSEGRTLKAHVALRKHPDGTLTVQAVPARPADAARPELVAAMAGAADQLRRDAGLPFT